MTDVTQALPGPWFVRHPSHADGRPYVQRGAPEFTTVAASVPDAATAELIAAAPDLLRALADLYDFPNYPTPADGEMSDPEVWEAQRRWQEAWEPLEARVLALLHRTTPL